ncbi:MAG: replicative DNA helicase [bacterium]|nr:replicative DNA helicase [bacterium]
MAKKNKPIPESTPFVEAKENSFLSSAEIEKYILGTILTDASSLSIVTEQLEPAHFSSSVHAFIYQAILRLDNQHLPIDIVMLTDFLVKNNQLEEAGGISYINQLIETTVYPSLLEAYCTTVRNKWIIRALGQYAREIIEQVSIPGIEAESMLDEFTSKIFDLSRKRGVGGFRRISEFLVPTLQKVTDYNKRQATIIGVPTGFKDLNQYTGGFQKGELIIIAARPSVGKTSLALNMALSAAKESGKRVGFISLEMSAEQIILRLLAMTSKLPLHLVRTGRLNAEEFDRLFYASEILHPLPIFIDDRSDQGLNEIRAKVRRLKKENDIDILFLDYLGLIRQPEKVESVQVAIANATRALKSLAKDLAIPIVVLAQLNRAAVDDKSDKRPKLHNLRDSGAIEQDADVVIFLYREQYEKYKKKEELTEEEKKKLKNAEIIIAKQRNGPTGTIEVVFINEYASFEEKEKIYETYVQSETPRQEEYVSRKKLKIVPKSSSRTKDELQKDINESPPDSKYEDTESQDISF